MTGIRFLEAWPNTLEKCLRLPAVWSEQNLCLLPRSRSTRLRLIARLRHSRAGYNGYRASDTRLGRSKIGIQMKVFWRLCSFTHHSLTSSARLYATNELAVGLRYVVSNAICGIIKQSTSTPDLFPCISEQRARLYRPAPD